MNVPVSNHRFDAIVIGGGLVGLSAARSLRLRGLDVLLLEATGVARHASSASAGGVRSLNRHPAEIALARAALSASAGTRVLRQWAGIEGMVSDGLPIVGPSKQIQGLIHAFGYSAHGFALVPVLGPLIADIATGVDINLSIDAFSVDRFKRDRSNQAA